MKRLTYLPAAIVGLKAITLYIAEDSPPGLRVARHGRYLIVFEDGADEVRVVRGLHGARDIARIFDA